MSGGKEAFDIVVCSRSAAGRMGITKLSNGVDRR